MHHRSTATITRAAVAASLIAIATSTTQAQINVTEWAYQGANGEFVELTNTGTAAVDFTGWSFDDDSAIADTVDLSAFGTVAPGESVLVTEGGSFTSESFRTAWNLPTSVKIVSGGTVGFGRNDVYNIFDAADVLVESFAYGDQTFPGSPRTQNISANIPQALLSSPNATLGMPLSTVGDSFGSYASTGGDVGNPGRYIVPEPASLAAIAGAALLAIRRTRR